MEQFVNQFQRIDAQIKERRLLRQCPEFVENGGKCAVRLVDIGLLSAAIVLTQQSKIQLKSGHQFLGVMREPFYIKIDFNALIKPCWENIAVLGRLLTDGKIIFLQVYVGSVIQKKLTSSCNAVIDQQGPQLGIGLGLRPV